MLEVHSVKLREVTDVALRLFVFPHAGGSPSGFRDWPKFLGEDVELVSYQLPGRGPLRAAEPYTRMEPLVADLADMIEANDDGTPFVFFGHSFGALVAHLVGETLKDRGATLPKQMILSAHRAPHLKPRHEAGDLLKHELPEQEFLEVVRAWGLIPDEVLSDRAFLNLALPALRADLEVDETCVVEPLARSPIPCQLFFGSEDRTVSAVELDGWSAHYNDLKTEAFPGGHFYLIECEQAFAASLNRTLEEVNAACPRSVLSAQPAYDYDTDTLWQRFEAQVARQPKKDAVVYGERRVSFEALRDTALDLACALQNRGVEKGDAIGFFLPHCTEYSTAMLASTYLGAPACLLETGWTDHILHMFLASVKPKAVLTTPELIKRLPETLRESGAVITFGETEPELPHVEAKTGPAELTGEDIAMISMTSGSTGQPKAVLTTHEGCRYCFDARFDRYPYSPNAREGLNVFFAWECLRPLLAGVTSVIIPDGEIFDAVTLVDRLESEQITRIIVTTSLLESVLEHPIVGPTLRERLSHMEMWLLMGEVVPNRVVEKARALLPEGVGLVNAYSTWESLDISFADLLDPKSGSQTASASAGHLIGGSTAVILDGEQNLLPYGAVGELYFASPGIAPGYFDDPEKTAQRFVRFGAKGAKRGIPDLTYYRTGDRARFLRDGQLHILGRMDDTVKLRGFKVSLFATERTLEAEPGVARAIVRPVIDPETGQPTHTIAYIHGDSGLPSGTTLAKVELRAATHLPEYARPRHYLGLEKIPLREGESRKLDLSKLPPPPTETAPKAAARLTGIEAKVAEAWKQVLNLKHVSPEDNFFSHGGDSLSAARLTGVLAEKYGITFRVLDVFQYPTLAQMVAALAPPGADGSAIRRRDRRTPQASTKLAVVGMAGRFPGADSIFSFWENLKAGKDSLSVFDRDMLARKGVPEEVLNDPNWVPVGQKIDKADTFDAGFWSISRREAEFMDPQHRVFIEVAASALEQAGYARRNNPYRQRTGVFASCGIDGYLFHHLEGGGLKTPIDPSGLFLTEIGNEKDYIATRVSYLLDLGGPSVAVMSACSSALVAVAQGAQSILSGQCDMAIAGGSSITFPNFGYCYEDGLVGSEDGHVRPFDQAASGTLFGDSVGAIVLKRLDDAIVDGDHIWAVMSGFGLSNDGSVKAGFAAPSAQAQSRCISDAIDMAGISSDAISYVECHATATLVGDAIEIKGLKDAFDAHRSDRSGTPKSCRIGSVKGNIGHANCAAGITGFIKTALCLHHRTLPGTANFETLNPKLVGLVEADGSPFSVQTELEPWEVADPAIQVPRRAGISSFGIGGTNAHVILEEAPALPRANSDSRTTALHLVPLSGKTSEALARNCVAMADKFRKLEPCDLGPAVRTMQTRREHHTVRAAAVISGDPQRAADAIRTLGEAPSRKSPDHPATIAFSFSGQGSQHAAMARALYSGLADAGRFRTQFNEVCACLQPYLDTDPVELLLKADPTSVKRPLITQCGLFAVEYALAASLIDIGIKPVAMAGHSIGEYAAAAISGLLDKTDAAKLVAHRALASEAMLMTQKESGKIGGMLSVAGDVEVLRSWLADRPNLWLAVENTPEQVVIAGLLSDLTDITPVLSDLGFRCREVPVSHPFHSALMQPVADRVDQAASGLVSATPEIPLASNVTGRWIGSGGVPSDYWGQHVVSRVAWRSCVDQLLQWEPDIILEIGPGHVLTNLVGKCLRAHPDLKAPILVPTLPEFSDVPLENETRFLKMIASLWSHGAAIDWKALHQRETTDAALPPMQPVLPTYSFEPTSIWVRPEKSIYVGIDEPRRVTPTDAPLNCLVRKGSARAAKLKLYCFTFAGSAASSFKHWQRNAPKWLDVVAIEYPGRGVRIEEAAPNGSSEIDTFLNEIATAIRADVGRGRFAVCGMSLGVTIAMALLTGPLRDLAQSGQLVGVSLVGRAPFGADNEGYTTDAQSFLLAPPEVQSDLHWKHQVLPLLTRDLSLDAHFSRSLAMQVLDEQRLTAPMQIHCGDADPSFTVNEIDAWTEWTSNALFDVRMHVGDHSFILEAERDIFDQTLAFLETTLWTAELPRRDAIDPVHRVLLSPTRKPSVDEDRRIQRVQLCADGDVALAETLGALAQGNAVVLLCKNVDLSSLDRSMAWLLEYLQALANSETSGELLIVVPNSAVGGALAGLTKTLGQEGVSLNVRRLVIADDTLWSKPDLADISRDAFALRGESDLVARNGCLFAERLARPDLPDLEPGTLGKVPGIYLVTGATGGLGSAVIEWLHTHQGVTPDKIVAVSRRGGADAVAGIRDVRLNSEGYLELESVLNSGERLAGVLHLAGALDDGLLISQTSERMREVMAPKRALSELVAIARSRGAPWILAFSSTTSLLGAAGQSNYAAANAYMDAAADWEAPAGGPALASIHWGSWAEVGMSARNLKAMRAAQNVGEYPLTSNRALDGLGKVIGVLLSGSVSSGRFAICDVDWAQSPWQDFPLISALRPVAHHLPDRVDTHAVTPVDAIKTSETEKANPVRAFLGAYVHQWDESRNLHALGLDSLDFARMRGDFSKTFGKDVPLMLIARPDQTLGDLYSALCEI